MTVLSLDRVVLSTLVRPKVISGTATILMQR
jgi:hypothetical protein